jgi:hypothetical protein
VAVWSTGAFGHVAEVVGTIPGGFRVAEENFSGGLGVTDVRDVTGSALSGLQGFILAPGSSAAGFNPLGALGDAAGAVLGVPQAIAGLPASVGHGLADAGGAAVANATTFFRNQIVALVVALVVAIVLWGGHG